MTWPTLEAYGQWLLDWDDTPYHDGMCKRGAGVDCLRFLCAAYDWLHGYDVAALPPVPELSPQTSMHDAGASWGIVRFLEERYPDHEIIRIRRGVPTRPLRPADALVVRNARNPAHAIIAGVERNVLWHSLNSLGADHGGGVCRTGLGWATAKGILRVWRPTGARAWR